MIGILKPDKMELLVKDAVYYKLYYCSLCRNLVRNHTRLHAFLNCYEGTLLAMLYNEMVVQDIGAVKDRCSGLPIARVPVLPADHPAVEAGALICMLAFQIKFQDDLMDEEGFWISRYNRYFLHRANKTFAGMEEAFQKFNIDWKYIRARQKELNRLERDEKVRNIEIHLKQWGETFSYIMTQPFLGKIHEDRHAALKDFFAGLGRTIYLMDSMSDLHEDRREGKFNLLLRAEPGLNTEDTEALRKAFDKYSRKIVVERNASRSHLPRLQLRESLPLTQNILTHCLDKEMKKVFELMVSKKKDSRKLLFNCQDF